ncbi:hypothetical protein GpartN1_g2854.t1 [Galdieria partita]|uniref:Mediator of RNA polymerase II transcription subunit 4 n=1 Tax=Galdieria partita TaxID=83374 RepID=A0A9C7UPN7_9RHOD|nr:hypothetical protein GpartN1_g2854.t1 [Galdieria partita]
MEQEHSSSATSLAQTWLLEFRSSCQQLFQLVLEETRQSSYSLDSSESNQLQTLWSRLLKLQSQLPNIVEQLEQHKERQMYLEYLTQVERDLDMRIATVLEKLLHALESLHNLLKESQPLLQSSALSPKSTLSEILSSAIRITGSLSAPTNYEEGTLSGADFAPAPTEEMIRASKMAQWKMQ